MSFLASITGYYGVTLGVGGPSMWVWGWLVSWVLITIVSYSMAEICSAYPSAGSVYHWAGQLTPKKWGPLAAYVTGAYPRA